MTDSLFNIIGTVIITSCPLLLATLGAVVTERAGVLAVFLDGAITLAGFLCIVVTNSTGSAIAGVIGSCAAVVLLLALLAIFNEKTGANPFIVGLACNLLATGLTSLLSVAIYKTRGTILLAHNISFLGATKTTLSVISWIAPIILAVFFYWTTNGIALRASGSAPEVLSARGLQPARYRVSSWTVAAGLSALAGSALAFSINAWVPSLSAGRGWTALAACYLGKRNPLICIAAVVLFTIAQMVANFLQADSGVPATIILGSPYLFALLAFIFWTPRKNSFKV